MRSLELELELAGGPEGSGSKLRDYLTINTFVPLSGLHCTYLRTSAMNFLDAYDATAPVNPAPNQPEQSLNEEVSQVFGQLGRFWGGFKQQASPSSLLWAIISFLSLRRANLLCRLHAETLVMLSSKLRRS